MTNHTSLMKSLVRLKTSKHGSIGSHWFLNEMKLDTYISWKVPVPEGDEVKILTQEELGQGQEDNCWFNNGSPYNKIVFPKETERDVWFLNQAIWRKEQLEVVKEEVKNVEVVMATLNSLPGSWDSFMQGMCARRKWLLLANSKKKNMGAIEDQALTIQRRSLKQWGTWRTQILKNLLSILEFG